MTDALPTPVVDDKVREDEAPKAAPAAKTYIVQSRDTWGWLEKKFGKHVAADNGLTIHDPLIAGQVLEVKK
jgi:LysM repeat protein